MKEAKPFKLKFRFNVKQYPHVNRKLEYEI